MKRCLLAAGVLSIFCAGTVAQSPAENELYEKLVNGPDKIKALDAVLKKPDEYSTVILFVGAGAALKEKRLEDSAFLFYAARLRARFDKECFPPKGTGGNSPFVAFAALGQQYSMTIMPAITAEPKLFAKSVERIKKWNPKVTKNYDPGYDYTERKADTDAHEAAKPNRTEYIKIMSDLSTLLNDPEYFAAFRVGQVYNFVVEGKRPTDDEYEKAVKTMKRIEKEKGLSVLGK
jgi:preprotein translocase subunit Sss1